MHRSRRHQNSVFKVGESVRMNCNLPDTPTASPQFDFDHAALRPRGMGILDGTATCPRERGAHLPAVELEAKTAEAICRVALGEARRAQ
jgi:hypothetical protein